MRAPNRPAPLGLSRRQVLGWAAGGPLCAAATALRPARAAPLGSTADELFWINRLTYGINSATLARFRQLGRQRYIEEQLAPLAAQFPPAVEQALRERPPAPVVQLLQEQRRFQALQQQLADGSAQKIAARQAQQAQQKQLAQTAVERNLLRALHSPRQIEEQMVAFWLNHFSVFMHKGGLRALVADYEDHAIRPHALGRFRNLLLATMTHPAMLLYLDNAQSAVGRINENYARELLELHTLGINGGYTQQDIQELARVLTGAGVMGNEPARLPPELANARVERGAFEFNPRRHDPGAKVVLGRLVPGSGYAELQQVADVLASHRSTARFIARKLAVYWVQDEPPAALVEQLAARFLESGGDIARVLAQLLASPEFAASLGHKLREPRAYVLACLRLGCDSQPLTDMQPVAAALQALGQLPFSHPTPEGYGQQASDWASSGQMNRRFEVARALARRCLDWQRQSGGVFDLRQHAVYARVIEPRLSAATRSALAQAASPIEWATLLFSAPEWMQR